ncbi:hypothetical protein [Roseovarius autotrophicus]|uniref:hypothetical protein n=1 Tax=Roseovarius autotrophicus TaxID=2824121 RepID=UPI001A024206|nr:hypothetical protein [Roseovarius autotrophicus]MBE0453340.1 hypothetical protein [Roseovarius sp.]
MRQAAKALPVFAVLLALVLSLPVLGLHGFTHGAVPATDTAQHLHHIPTHPTSPDDSLNRGVNDSADIACKALCTGPLLATATDASHPAALRLAPHRSDAPRLWVNWTRPQSPPPKPAA